MAVVALVLSGLFHKANARTITTEDKVVLEVVSETDHTVRVAIENQSLHSDNASFITIPEKVTDPTDGQVYTVTEIVVEAFQATAITGIDIQAKIAEIPAKTFYECANLETVVFPSTLETIGASAFYKCSKLVTPDFPEGLTQIGSQAFAYALMGKELVFPPAVVVGGSAFRNTTLPSVVFPEEDNGFSFGSGCFQSVKGLATVVLPSYIKSVPSSAFMASSVRSVDLSKITSESFYIGDYAFKQCKSLTSVIFPVKMSEIRREAFISSGLASLKLPEVDKIGMYAFESTKITSMPADSWPATPIASIGRGAFRKSSLNDMALPPWMTTVPRELCYDCNSLKSLSLPEGVESIETDAFSSTIIETLDFPSTLKSISSSFTNCDGLTELHFPDGLTHIYSSFRGCSELTTVVFGNGLETIGEESFKGCNKLSSVILPANLKSIDERAFESCISLHSIDLPQGLETIGDYAFLCAKLQSIEIPASVKKVGRDSFCYNSLESVILPATPIEFTGGTFSHNPLKTFEIPVWMTKIPSTFLDACQLESVSFHNGVTTVGSGAFQDNHMLVVGSLPETITEYESNAFENCGDQLPDGKYFASVYIGRNVTVGKEAFKNAKIRTVGFLDCDYKLGSDVFKNVTSVESISFPDCMTKIPDGICNGWKNLKDVRWPAQLDSIGANAFFGCESLVFGRDENGDGNVIDFGKAPFAQIEYIGDGAFWGSSLTKVVWPSEVENFYIGNNAFRQSQISEIVWPESVGNFYIWGQTFKGNESLGSVHIPSWMDRIPDYIFDGCRNLTEVIWDESLRTDLTIGYGAFSNTGIPVITWPNVPTTIYGTAFKGAKSATRIEWPEQPVTLAGNDIFSDCEALVEPQTVPDYITSIPDYSFRNCTALPAFTLPASVTAIGTGAFQGCSSIEEFRSNASVEEISSNCFKDCTALRHYYTAHPVTRINKEAFYNCSSLETFELNNGETRLELIASAAFADCFKLEAFPEVMGGATKVNDRAFFNCQTIKHITLPSVLDDNEHFSGAKSLQAIDFMLSPEERFRLGSALYNNTFDYAPLLGVSYALFDLEYSKIWTWKYWYNRAQKGILMVNRDQKYKLMENGYGALWDIREVKKPDLTLHGDIHSEFTPGDLRNHYKTMIRWEVVESDLDENAPTVYHLNRDGVEIARIEISTCELLDHVSDGNIQRNEPTNSYKIRITREGVDYDKAEQYGDFDYEFEPGGYVMVYSNQHKNLYFHPGTSHRIGLNERMGAKSWFLFIDEFDSPDLNEPGVPDRYTYTLAMDGYDYREPVNNEGYLPGEDGLYWHYENRRLDRVESEPCVVHTAMAVPSMSVDGLYSLEDIEGDTAGVLPVSEDVMAEGISARLSYEFSDLEQIGHTLFEAPMHYPIIDHIVCYELPSRENLGLYSELQRCDIKGDKSLATGDIPVPADHDPAIGSSYQIVTSTLCRGTFGSRIVTIPGTPRLDASMEKLQLCYSYEEHNHEPVFRATLNLMPDASRMGYSGVPSDSQHSIGVWRAIDRKSVSNEMLADEGVLPDELVFHMGQDYMAHSWSCDDCSAHQKYDTSDGQWRYTDHFAIGSIPQGQLLDVNADYRVRMYVQTVEDPSRWMIAEARAVNSEVVSGVEEVRAGISSSEPVYYNLQGMRVPQPMEGETVIVVDARGSRKVIYKRE